MLLKDTKFRTRKNCPVDVNFSYLMPPKLDKVSEIDGKVEMGLKWKLQRRTRK